ncbi:MAG: hypothetical protein ACYS5V_16920 [Planctomycetota bacterium]|jgi:hypothetical protein
MITQREIKLELKDSLKDLSQVTTKAISDYVYKNLNSSDDIDLVKEVLNNSYKLKNDPIEATHWMPLLNH